jgi:DNA-binding NarL/FixJ family response regulator
MMDDELLHRGVLVADRQALFRHGLVGLLRENWPTWSFDQAGNFEITMRHAASLSPDLFLLDLDLPGMDGTDGVQQLRAAYPDGLVMVLADTDDRATILQCLSAGAQGYVLKCASPMQFLRALETVLSGGVFAPATLSGKPLAAPEPPQTPHATHELDPILAQLTDRQCDVFRLLAEGCATKTIARRLDLAVGTVKVHLAAIYRALGAHSRLEALAKARSGMVWPNLRMSTATASPSPALKATAGAFLG